MTQTATIPLPDRRLAYNIVLLDMIDKYGLHATQRHSARIRRAVDNIRNQAATLRPQHEE